MRRTPGKLSLSRTLAVPESKLRLPLPQCGSLGAGSYIGFNQGFRVQGLKGSGSRNLGAGYNIGFRGLGLNGSGFRV